MIIIESHTVMMTMIALVINTIALIVVIKQTRFTKEALVLTKKSVDDSKIQRQLEILPKFNWVIQVWISLESWKKDLRERISMLETAIKQKNEAMLKKASVTKVNKPQDLGLHKFSYKNMPSWLSELWVSGAQYYYDPITLLSYIYKDDTPNYDYAKNWVNGRGRDSLRAISKLLEYFEEMVPDVILETPASIDNDEFFSE